MNKGYREEYRALCGFQCDYLGQRLYYLGLLSSVSCSLLMVAVDPYLIHLRSIFVVRSLVLHPDLEVGFDSDFDFVYSYFYDIPIRAEFCALTVPPTFE